jgi:hypothetical protein
MPAAYGTRPGKPMGKPSRRVIESTVCADNQDRRPASRVKTHGKITKLPRHCDQTDFTPTLTVKRVDLKQPKA